MSGAPDLRQVLKEKAANHSSFYRRLRSTGKHMASADAKLEHEEHKTRHEEEEVKCSDRPRSRDSAVDLDDPSILTDALRTLSNDSKCYDSGGEHDAPSSPYDRQEYCEEHCCYHIRSKMILEAQYVDYPEDPKCCEETDTFDPSGRRPSVFSWDGDEGSRVRKVRTPSVVISDYSDDVHAGISLEELEYFRSHVEDNSPSSGRSSCSNLDSRCGSQLSVLDLEDSRCGSHLSVIDLDDSTKVGASPSVSDAEDDDSGVERQHTPKKIENPH